MTVRIYKSTDGSAPVLTGQAGSLTTLLDAVLVNGYGSQTAAGWSINQTTTNKRGYKQNLTGSNNSSGMLLYVDDTAAGTGGAKEARVCGFETMSAITPTGTGQFPTAAQSSIGTGFLIIRKSTTADATARAWTIIANGQTIYLFIESGDTTAATALALATTGFAFGDFKSYKTSDQYAVMIIGRVTENTGSSLSDAMQMTLMSTTGSSVTLSDTNFGHFIARSWTGVGSSVRCAKREDMSKWLYSFTNSPANGQWTSGGTTAGGGNSSMGRYPGVVAWPFPNGPDGGIHLSPLYLSHSGALRGYLSGLWAPLHDRPLVHAETVTFSGGNLSGKSMIAQNIMASISSSANGDYGQIMAEYSDTWT
jgi:hypothetical protein